jgi:ethanolamine utilization protein EutQ (cupin superfamily)|tara:strand:+ start:3247 stop:3582 length:336 start_codon:yes stop_codon:yes gene_type:complete
VVLHPPQNGTILRIIEFGPEDPAQLRTLDGKSAFARMGAVHAVIENARHPLMHRTDSVDYAIVLEGEITMLLDDTEYLLKAGDVVVQRGTNHAWSDQSKYPCHRFVLIDGK